MPKLFFWYFRQRNPLISLNPFRFRRNAQFQGFQFFLSDTSIINSEISFFESDHQLVLSPI
jgi:hypothetical protein